MTRFKVLLLVAIGSAVLVGYALYLRSTSEPKPPVPPSTPPTLDSQFLEGAREKPEEPPPPPLPRQPPPRQPLRYEDLVPPPESPPAPAPKAADLDALERANNLTAVRLQPSESASPASSEQALRRLQARTLVAGTLIEAQLDQPLRTDQPTAIAAHSLRPVYDFYRRTVLLPAGTRFLGTVAAADLYDAGAELHWHRLITPDGRSVDLDEPATSSDDDGGAVNGRRQTHKRHKAAAVLVTALTTAAVDAARPDGDTVNIGATAGAETVSGTETLLSRWAQRALSRPPTLHLDAGTKIFISVRADLAL